MARRLLAAWLALLPVTPVVAEMLPPAAETALCGPHACRCRKPAARREAAPRSCHESAGGYVSAACNHDPIAAASPSGTAPYLVAPRIEVAPPVARVTALAPRVAAWPDAFPGVDPPPPRRLSA